ncbi:MULTISPECIES: glycosyltransferase family 2 protein [Empedobacter]|uniref:Glycosyltransferase family 2 protein n=1 Tax=Empedobacter falsenii TaxID=343874 RepID=A0A7H9DP70_9FLAO|nr:MULTISPECIES: glycosyltransferase family 2 protein [Empedobacter]QLL56894.1 glycosyltransferase family 2 protein [Empedobacter falsenii]
MLKVSVIIPNYNHSSYLKERIDSVLNQTFQDFEVIILDDCSTDNSKEIIEAYRNHPKISHIVYNEKNSGSTFKQWKKGIELSKGEWIWIAESDDWCNSLFLETLISDTDDNLSVIYCQSVTYLPNNLQLIRHDLHPYVIDIDSDKFINEYLLKGNVIYNASMAIFKKSKFLKITSDEYTKYKFCGDWIFWSELAFLGKVRRYNRLLNNFRKTDDNNVTSRTVKLGNNYIEDVNALHYFKNKYNCNHVIYIKELKKYYFKSKEINLENPIKNKIKDNFIEILGNKKILFWDLKYFKNKLITNIYKKIKENV